MCTHAHANACMAHHHQQARYTTPNQAKSNSGQAARHAADEVDRSSHYSGQPLAAIRPAKPPATHRRGHRPLSTPLAILINPMTTHRPTCRLAWGLDSPPRRANRRPPRRSERLWGWMRQKSGVRLGRAAVFWLGGDDVPVALGAGQQQQQPFSYYVDASEAAATRRPP